MRLLVQQIGDSPARACDEKCYGAVGDSKCKCICGGRNHGVGYEKAIDNVIEDYGDVAAVFTQMGGYEIGTQASGSKEVSNVAGL